MTAGRAAAACVGLVVFASTAVHGDAPKLDVLLTRLSSYLADYEQQMSAVVADEYYRQEFVEMEADFDRTHTRVLQSDFAFMRIPGELVWLGLRDTYAVDSKPVRDRDGRLEVMLSGAGKDALRQARRIAEENARYNLGDLPRTINIPTLAIGLLLPQHRRRFTFRLAGEETIGNTRVVRVDFQERQRPSVIRSREGGDQPASGAAWLDPSTGGVHRTQLDVGTIRARLVVNTRIVVDYARDERLDMLVPRQMTERYDQPLDRSFRGFTIEATATYMNYRRFQTSGRLVP
jgi:hypothetical protein